MALTEAQKKAQKKYNEKNREKRSLLSMKTSCKSFIKNHATLENLLEIEQFIQDRRDVLNSEDLFLD